MLVDTYASGRSAPVRPLVHAYERHLAQCLLLRQGTVLPGVPETLDAVDRRRDVAPSC